MAVSADRIGYPTDSHRAGSGDVDTVDFEAYIRRLTALAEDCCTEKLPMRVAREVRRLVRHDGWLPASCCRPGDDTYRRHVLYADPEGRFTVLSVVWRPGQGTPVHGHTAWGAVGVYRGSPSVSNYRLVREGTAELVCDATCGPGDVTCVQPGIEYPHRVYNASDDLAITIHTYGRDLVADPGAINILI